MLTNKFETKEEGAKIWPKKYLAHLVKNGGCEDLVTAAPRQPQLVKQGAHLSGLCDLLRGFRLKILVYRFAFHPTHSQIWVSQSRTSVKKR